MATPKLVCAIDIGNTNINFYLFRGATVVKTLITTTDKKVSVRQFAEKMLSKLQAIYSVNIDAFVIASVVPSMNPRLKKVLKSLGARSVYVIGQELQVPIINRYKHKKEVGIDRLVNAVAAYKRTMKQTLVIDFGTAVTFDLVGRDGSYLGGVIFPGINVSLKAMSSLADLLPDIQIKKPRKLLGQSTTASMQSGICYGYGSLCDGIIREFTRQYGQLTIVATGGQAGLISKFTDQIDLIDPYLTAKGIFFTYQQHKNHLT